MRLGWDEAPAPGLPRPGWTGRLRIGLRAPAAVLTAGPWLVIYLVSRGIDAGAGALWPGVPRRIAPLVLQGWGRTVLAILGLRLERQGRAMEGAGALVANHASWIDIVVLLAAAPSAFVSKSEVGRWPVIGTIGRIIGTVFIDRRRGEAGRQTELLGRRLARGDRLCLFAEGTSTDGQRVLAFKSSLFGVFFEPELRGRVAVQPVSIRYRPPEGLPRTLYGWWGTMDFGAHLLAVLAQPGGGVVRVVLHPPLPPAEAGDRKALAAAARASVLAGFEAAGEEADPRLSTRE